MEFRIVSHACLDITAQESGSSSTPGSTSRPTGPRGGTARLHFGEDIYEADYVYITHWHFDHFDPKTLKKFGKHTTAVVAKFPISGLRQQLESLGFERVVELRHGERLKLADDFGSPAIR